MGLLGGAIGAIGKIGGGIGKLAGGLGKIGGAAGEAAGAAAGGGAGGALQGIGDALNKGLEIFGGIKGLIDQAKGGGEQPQQAGNAEQAQQAGAQQAEGQQGEEHPLLRLAKMVLEAIEDPKKLEEIKKKVPKEFAGLIDQIAQAAGQMKQAA